MKEFLKKVFISPDETRHETRLRAGWRLLVQFAILIGLGGLLGFVFNLLTLIFQDAAWIAPYTDGIGIMALDIAFVLSVYIARRLIDRRSFSSLGLQKSPAPLKDILVGIAIAGVMMGTIYLVELTAGWLTPLPSALTADPLQEVITGLVTWAFIFIAVGFAEEIFSRGYQLQNMEDGLNTFWAVLLSSSLFGLLHIGNPSATWVSTLGILAAGLFLAYGYLSTRQLWLPIGLHIGWNFFEGPFFGFPVSGLNPYRLLRHNITGPELITGGPFGPEAGLVLLFGLGIGAGLIYVYTRGRLETQE